MFVVIVILGFSLLVYDDSQFLDNLGGTLKEEVHLSSRVVSEKRGYHSPEKSRVSVGVGGEVNPLKPLLVFCDSISQSIWTDFGSRRRIDPSESVEWDRLGQRSTLFTT